MTPFHAQIEVPNDHPALPRLLAAARRLPDVVLEGPGGVTLRKQQLTDPQAISAFFDALIEVLGEDAAVELLLGIAQSTRAQRVQKQALCNQLRKLTQVRDPEELAETASDLFKSPLLLGLLGLLKNQGR